MCAFHHFRSVQSLCGIWNVIPARQKKTEPKSRKWRWERRKSTPSAPHEFTINISMDEIGVRHTLHNKREEMLRIFRFIPHVNLMDCVSVSTGQQFSRFLRFARFLWFRSSWLHLGINLLRKEFAICSDKKSILIEYEKQHKKQHETELFFATCVNAAQLCLFHTFVFYCNLILCVRVCVLCRDDALPKHGQQLHEAILIHCADVKLAQ